MGKIIVKNAVVREPGFLYYIDGEGNVCRSPMASKGKKTAKKAVAKPKNAETKKAASTKKKL